MVGTCLLGSHSLLVLEESKKKDFRRVVEAKHRLPIGWMDGITDHLQGTAGLPTWSLEPRPHYT